MPVLIGKAVAWAVFGAASFVTTVIAFTASADSAREALRIGSTPKVPLGPDTHDLDVAVGE